MSVNYEELARRYGMQSLSTNWNDDEAEIVMSLTGVTQLFRDYQTITANKFLEDGNVESLKLSDSEYVVLRFDVRKVDSHTVLEWAEEWGRMLPDKRVLLIPNEMYIECWGKEQLVAYKDALEKIIHDLSFDNLVGF